MQGYDHIIIGQGIAGSVLAMQLMEKNKKILVIDALSISSSSKVAAGIWNPVVFKRLTRSWMADEILPEMFSFYLKAEKKTKNKFLHVRNIAKQFTEEQEKSLWKKKSAGDMQHYLDETIYPDHPVTANDFALVLNSGNIDVTKFLQSVKAELLNKEMFLEELFNYHELKIFPEGIEYKNFKSASIIFCEGFNCTKNPFFNHISFKPAKGEVLTIKCEGLKTQQIINKGVFILPVGNDLYKVGATYEWDELGPSITEKAKQELTEKLDKVLKLPYSIINHEAGIRPSVIDRRPVIGTHPEHPALKVFNGMGTKGVMLAPYFAKHFIDFLEGKSHLNPEINVERFKQYFNP